jgi:hypothetical protein
MKAHRRIRRFLVIGVPAACLLASAAGACLLA